MPKVTYERESTQGLVTVVIPAYRADDFIGHALHSISQQTYRHWELVVVEDASQGQTEDLVRQFANDHPGHRIAYRRNENNSGPSFSRNVAFQEAAGEFIALLDADDRWLAGHLAAAVEKLESAAADLAYSSVVMIEDRTERLLGIWGPTQVEIDDFPHGLFTRNFITPSATVFRRSVVADVGLWSVKLRLCEDLDFWLRCVQAGKRFAHVGGCHCLYRQNRPEAATKNRCAVQEGVARVVAQYVGLPGTRLGTCRNRVVKSFARAAEIHRIADSNRDPSRDLRKIPELYMNAWKLRPKRIDYLLKAGWWSVRSLLSKQPPRKEQLPVSLHSVPAG